MDTYRAVKLSQTSSDLTMLAQLATHPEYRVRLNVARNPSTTADILKILINDEHTDIAFVAFSHWNTTRENIELFRGRKLTGADTAIARCVNMPVDILEEIAEYTDNDNTILALASNHTSSVKVIESIIPKCSAYTFKFMLTAHPNLPEKRLIEFSSHTDPAVRWQIAKHPSCPAAILYKIACDENDIVRKAALERL